MDNKNEPAYMQIIWDAVEEELAEEHETAVRELDKFFCYRAGVNKELEWSCEEIAKHLLLLHEGLIEWIGMMEEKVLIMLYFSTIANACIIRTNKETGGYESALYVLEDVDGIAVIADTEDASIKSGICDKLIMQRKLPYAEWIQSQTRKYYDIVSGFRQLESIAAPSGETLKILFGNIV